MNSHQRQRDQKQIHIRSKSKKSPLPDRLVFLFELEQRLVAVVAVEFFEQKLYRLFFSPVKLSIRFDISQVSLPQAYLFHLVFSKMIDRFNNQKIPEHFRR